MVRLADGLLSGSNADEFGQVLLDSLDHRIPIPRSRLAIDFDTLIPGAVGSAQEPSPACVEAIQ